MCWPGPFPFMPRKRREEMEGGVYHVFARGNDRMRIFRDERDYRLYLDLLRRIVATWGWTCLAYCLMPNHIHLVIQTDKANLADGMQRLHSLYAMAFNATYGRSGHLFGGRFGAKRIRDEAQLEVTLRYVELNAVDAGLADAPEDWRWCSRAAPVSDALLVTA